MALESVRPKAPAFYYGFKVLKDPSPQYRLLEAGTVVSGYYLKNYTKQLENGPQINYVLVDLEGNHHSIPGSKTLDEDMAKYAVIGALTAITYKGKNKFDYKKPDGTKGTASEHKWTVQQDKEDIRSFEGEQFAETVGGPVNAELKAALAQATEVFNTTDIPF